MTLIQRRTKMVAKHTRFTRKYWIKGGVFHKTPSSQILLDLDLFGLDLWVLNFATLFWFGCEYLTNRNGQNQALKNSSVELKDLTLALHFSLFFYCLHICFNVLTYMFSLGLHSVYVRNILSC